MQGSPHCFRTPWLCKIEWTLLSSKPVAASDDKLNANACSISCSSAIHHPREVRMNGQQLATVTRQVHDAQSKQEQLISLSHLLSRELQNERMQRPLIRCGHAAQQKKGEDFTLIDTNYQRIPGDRSSAFAVFAVLDGHNGAAAAAYAKDNLLKDVMGLIPTSLSRDEWLALLPKALVAGFIKTDKEFQNRKQSSGTTVTFVVVDGWTVTVASVGDSRCILDSQGGAICTLTVDHRLEENLEERKRVTASGGQVGRLSLIDGVEIGPLRCWPGGLCLSRSIGDMDVGEYIVPIPHVKQVKLSNVGGRLIIGSDGVWDSLSCERVAKCCRGLPAELAARQVVKEALQARGLRDDITCLVVDVMPPKLPSPAAPAIRRRSKLKTLFFWRRSQRHRVKLPDRPVEAEVVEALFEEGSTILAERLGADASAPAHEAFHCAVCEIDITPRDGLSVHAGSFFSMSSKPWEGPFLCALCKLKQDAMYGKKKQTMLGDANYVGMSPNVHAHEQA
ncbi:hypothetical protein L7F22_005743 [Adiantum nelumboides]|nr:hypothetical protein [Adiantum nelumboides]